MSLRTQTARKFDPWKQNGGNLPGFQIHNMELSTMITGAQQQRNATATSVRFFRFQRGTGNKYNSCNPIGSKRSLTTVTLTRARFV